MPSPLPTFKPGDPADKLLNSTFLNGIVERLGTGVDEQTRNSVGGIPYLSTVTASVTNRTGSDIAARSVVVTSGIELAIADSTQAMRFQTSPAFSANIPARTDDMPAIALEPIADGATGKVAIGGVAVCLTTEPGSNERFARAVPGETNYLEPSSSGPARILHRNPGTGLQWTVVYLCCGDNDGEGSGSGADAGGGGGVRCSGTVTSRPIFTKQSCIDDKVYRFYQLETWSYDSNGCLEVTRGAEYGEETEECCTSVECPDGGSGNPADTIITQCCINPIPTILTAEVVSDCGNFNVTFTYDGTDISGNVYYWRGSGNCSMCEEDNCEDSPNCWTLIAEYNVLDEVCLWSMYNCDALITFGEVSQQCDPLLIVLMNNNPLICDCAAGTTVTIS